MIELYITDIEPLKDADIYEHIYNGLSNERKNKADALKNEQKKCQSVAAGWLLEQKKHKSVYYNLSHSSELAVLAISDKEVGVDVEIVQKCRQTVINKCFSDAEQLVIAKTEDEAVKDRLFTQIWTQKESAAKLTKEGIARIIRRRNMAEEKEIDIKSFLINHKAKQYYISIACYGVLTDIEPKWEQITMNKHII